MSFAIVVVWIADSELGFRQKCLYMKGKWISAPPDAAAKHMFDFDFRWPNTHACFGNVGGRLRCIWKGCLYVSWYVAYLNSSDQMSGLHFFFLKQMGFYWSFLSAIYCRVYQKCERVGGNAEDQLLQHRGWKSYCKGHFFDVTSFSYVSRC